MPRIFATLALTLALVPAAARGGTNLLANGTFDDDAHGWSASFGADVSWNGSDELAEPTSGSLRLSGLNALYANDVISDCFAVTGGMPITFGASALGPPGVEGTAYLNLFYYSAPGCAGTPMGNLYPAAEDYYAFASTWGPVQGNGAAPDGAQSATLRLRTKGAFAPGSEVRFDNAFVYQDRTCAATATVACLQDQRFRVAMTWRTVEAHGYATLSQLTNDSARATFFHPDNVEVVLKVLDGCSHNDRYWVFAAGLTNVDVTLRVVDTMTQEAWTHHNPLHTAFPPVQDVDAFGDCAP
jgi:hypothetical protein